MTHLLRILAALWVALITQAGCAHARTVDQRGELAEWCRDNIDGTRTCLWRDGMMCTYDPSSGVTNYCTDGRSGWVRP